jgi:thermostable 8-oxoguanine DNA glycosylase
MMQAISQIKANECYILLQSAWEEIKEIKEILTRIKKELNFCIATLSYSMRGLLLPASPP